MERDVILASKWLNVAKNGRKRRPAPVPMAQTRLRTYHNVAFDLQARIRVEILARMDGAHAISRSGGLAVADGQFQPDFCLKKSLLLHFLELWPSRSKMQDRLAE